VTPPVQPLPDHLRDDASRPRPVRLAAGTIALLLVIIGALPVFGVPITAEMVGALLLVSGPLTGLVGILVERQVTPMSDPRDDAGRQLVPRRGVPPEMLQ
jgi:hypothetical protein